MILNTKNKNKGDSVKSCMEGFENKSYQNFDESMANSTVSTKSDKDHVFGLSTHVLNSKTGHMFFDNSSVSKLMNLEKSTEYGLSETEVKKDRSRKEVS